eukprot:PhF_6_TR35380/c0_g1_i1/m.51414/K08857/NEK1_4_5; NIMA (never in mitosis gene a)-related kinase 1/4/5
MTSVFLATKGFHVKKTLGKGSFGEALLVKDTRNGDRSVVVKVVRMASMSPQERSESLKEVSTMAAVPKHPNIVEMFDSFENDSNLYIVMEYAEVGDLERLLKQYGKTPLPEPLVVRIFTQLCLALQHLHGMKILHRDLKIQNIFLSGSMEKPVVKLGDFGISTVLRNTHAMARTVCGTPYYFSPEICENKPYNNKSDVWSLGCILYEMCTQKHAFEGASLVQLMRRIIRGSPNPIPSSYCSDVSKLVDSMLQRNPKTRPSVRRILTECSLISNAVRSLESEIGVVFPTKHQPQPQPVVAPVPLPSSQPKEPVVSAKMDEALLAESIKRFQNIRADVASGGAKRTNSNSGGNSGGGDVTSPVAPSQQAIQQRRRQSVERDKKDAEKVDRHLRVMALEEKRKMYENRGDKQKMIRQEEELQRRIDAVKQTEEKRKQLEQQGWEEVQEVRAKQEKRQVHSYVVDEHVEMLRRQMQSLEANKRGKDDFSVGGRPPVVNESDEYVMNRLMAKEARHRVSDDAPWAKQQDQIRPSLPPLAPSNNVNVDVPVVPIVPDPIHGGERTLDKFSLNQFLGRRPSGAQAQPPKPTAEVSPAVEALWHQHKEQIDKQRVVETSPAGEEWRKHQEKIIAQRRAVGNEYDNFGEDDDYFEDTPMPNNDVTRLTDMHQKFTLDGKTLHLTPVTAPTEARCRALREFLSQQLGQQRFDMAYDILSDVRTMDQEVSHETCAEMADQVGGTTGYMELIVQLIVCE